MKLKSGPEKAPAEQVLKGHSTSDPPAILGTKRKIRIVLEGLRGEESISELCRREGIAACDVLRLVEGVS